jgi:hypothetical protein
MKISATMLFTARFKPGASRPAAYLAVQESMLRIINAQIAALESKVADEERAAAAIRRAQAIRQVQGLLPPRLEIVAEIEAAVKGLPDLFKKLDQWRASFLKRYPADVERPYEFFISDDRVLQRVTAALHAIRIEDAHEAIDGLASEESAHHAELIADLQQNSAPHVETEAA